MPWYNKNQKVVIGMVSIKKWLLGQQESKNGYWDGKNQKVVIGMVSIKKWLLGQ